MSANSSHSKPAFDKLRKVFPHSVVVGCTTGGEIFEDEVFKCGAVGIALKFDSSHVKLARAEQSGPDVFFSTGESLVKDILAPDLAGVFVVSNGLLVNGSKLVEGLQSVLGAWHSH